MSDIPDRDRVAADEQRIGALLRAVEAPAPAALHRRIAAIGAERRKRRLAVGVGRVPPFALAGAFAAAVAAVLVLALVPGSGPTPPTALRASLVALAEPTAGTPPSLVAAGTSIRFPRWSGRGWPDAGTRSDRIGGRALTTEFYRSYDVGTLGYTIVSGAPLRWGGAGHTVIRGGAEYRVMNAGGAQIVAWVQDGHTCIIASRTAPDGALVALAVAQDRSSPA